MKRGIHSSSSDFFTKRRAELKRERFLERLHRQPLMTKVRRARFEAVEHIGNALGQGLGIEVYDCAKEQKLRATGGAGDPSSYRWSAPLAAVLTAH